MSRHLHNTTNVEDMMQAFGAGQFISGTTSGTIDTETTHAHDLGRVPRGFFVISQDKAGVIYNSDNPHTSTLLKVKAGADAGAVSIAFTAWVF